MGGSEGRHLNLNSQLMRRPWRRQLLLGEGWVTLTRGLMDEGRLNLMGKGWLAPMDEGWLTLMDEG